MLLKNSIIISGIIISLCTGSIAFAKSNNETSNNKTQSEGSKMLLSKPATSLKVAEDYSEYAYTAQILAEDFGKDPAYILRFQQFTKAAGVTLDPLFLGLKDSKPFTEKQNGYTDAQKAQGRVLLKGLVAQQFSKAKPSDNPTYIANPGAPGAGKTFALQQEFGIDVARGKFAANAITIGPDLIVMAQMEDYQNAFTLPTGDDRTKAMVAAYSHDRDLSNAAANFMFMMAVTDRLNIVHDSTMTAPTAAKLLDCLGKVGYQRIGRIFMADRVSRGGALDEKAKQNGGFALVTTKDALGKAVAAYERIADGSYMGRFDALSIRVQVPEFYLGNGMAVEVAKYDPATGKVHVLPGGQEHIDRIMQQARESEGLKPELLASLEQAVSGWEKAPEVRERASSVNKM